MSELTNEQIEDILSFANETIYPTPVQIGPLRHYDKVMRCASRGCSSPTYFKLKGIPYCMIHCMRLMNEMLVAHGDNE